MTADDLYTYRGLVMECKALQAQIDSLYYTPVTARLDSVPGGRKSADGTSDPTARVVDRIAGLQQLLEKKQQDLADRLLMIEHDVDAIPDPQVRAIIRLHFLSGLTWGQTGQALGEGFSGDAVRKQFRRWSDGQIDKVSVLSASSVVK